MPEEPQEEEAQDNTRVRPTYELYNLNSPGIVQNADDYASDNLDDTDTEARPKKKAKLSKAAEAKAKAKAKSKAKKKKGNDDGDYSDSGSDDAYTALSKMWKDNKKPPVGSFEDCAKCGNQFTVVRATPIFSLSQALNSKVDEIYSVNNSFWLSLPSMC